MQKIVILFSGEGTNLEVLIQNLHLKSCCVVSAITNKANAKGIIKAKNLNVHVDILEHNGYESREAFDKDLVALIGTYEPDLVVLAGFMRILTPTFTSNIKAINIHPSLLPLFKGANAIEKSFESSEKEGGISVHYVSDELDGGKIILQKSFLKSNDETAESFKKKVQKLEHLHYHEAVSLALNN